MVRVLDKILRAGEGKILRKLKAISVQVNALEDDFRAMSDEELRALTPEFRARLDKGEITDKGSINQRAVLQHRDALVQALHDNTAPHILQPGA